MIVLLLISMVSLMMEMNFN